MGCARNYRSGNSTQSAIRGNLEKHLNLAVFWISILASNQQAVFVLTLPLCAFTAKALTVPKGKTRTNDKMVIQASDLDSLFISD